MTNHLTQSEQAKETETTNLGFWIYLMTDCVLFATLFATYAVLRNNTFGGPGAGELFSLPFVFVETLLLLTSSFTIGLAVLAAHQKNIAQVKLWLWSTLILGATFLGLELYEFTALALEGHSWQSNGFLSAYFTLLGTHGLHILAGLIWIIVLTAQILSRGITAPIIRRLGLLAMFWHFLDIVWIFIFTMVYLMGAL